MGIKVIVTATITTKDEYDLEANATFKDGATPEAIKKAQEFLQANLEAILPDEYDTVLWGYRTEPTPTEDNMETCPNCEGKGIEYQMFKSGYPCTTCDGRGWTYKDAT